MRGRSCSPLSHQWSNLLTGTRLAELFGEAGLRLATPAGTGEAGRVVFTVAQGPEVGQAPAEVAVRADEVGIGARLREKNTDPNAGLGRQELIYTWYETWIGDAVNTTRKPRSLSYPTTKSSVRACLSRRGVPPLVIIKQDAILAEFLFQDLVLGPQVFDRGLLPTVQPTAGGFQPRAADA